MAGRRVPDAPFSTGCSEMPAPTSPPIFAAQNTEDAQRKVAAQARLYSDAKTSFNVRLAVIGVLALGSTVAALLAADAARTAIGIVGGLALLLISLVGADIEKRKRLQAAAVQEDFDTSVFRLPWNSVEARQRPSPVVIQRAAARYRGGREKNWYADTEGTHRPFDVLICQGSNLGWGATTHRLWAWALTVIVVACLAVLAAVTIAFGVSTETVLVALVAPAIAPLTEAVLQVKAHFMTGRDKEDLEGTINTAWADGMSGKEIPSGELLRDLQNRILSFRQRNNYVPDWFDKRLHAKNESAMRAAAADLVAEAARNGHG